MSSSINELINSLRLKVTEDSAEVSKSYVGLINFVNSTYHCGSEQARNAVPEIARILEGIFRLPFVGYFVDNTTQSELIQALYTCSKPTTGLREKQIRYKKKSPRELRAFFTGAIINDEGSAEREKRRPDKSLTISFKSVLDDVLKKEIEDSKERTKVVLMRIVKEIYNHLRKRPDDGTERRGDTTNSSEDTSTSTDDSKKLRADVNDSGPSDEILFDKNMEIAVRMNRDR